MKNFSSHVPELAEKRSTMPVVLSVVVVGLFLPEELSFYPFGLRLTVVRLLFLLLTPVLVAKAVARLSIGTFRVLPSDVLVVLAGFWLIYAPANVDGLMLALNHAGPNVLEFCIGYMSTRILLTERGQALHFMSVLCGAIALVALLGALDPLTNHFLIHDLAAQLGGSLEHPLDWRSNQDAYRFGILRAMGPVEHPILFGFVCSVGVIVSVALPIRFRILCALSCSFGAILSFSSAPIQGLFMGLGLLAYDRLFLTFPRRWLCFFILSATVLGLAFLISNNAIGFIISNLTFSPESGYYREWTWEMVTALVSQSPWLGLGSGPLPDEIPRSIDSLWLVLSIGAGYPGAVLVALSLAGANTFYKREISQESIIATTLGILLFLIFFVGFTVHVWGSTWILAGLLLGTKAHLTQLLLLDHGAERRPIATEKARAQRMPRQYRLPI